MRTKEFLSKSGVEFESFNILEDPSAMARLTQLGVRTVPVVVVGDRWAHGVQLDAVGELIGAAQTPDQRLPPRQLLERIDLVVTAAQRFIRQVPVDSLGFHSPDRDRPIKDLAYHVFLIVNGMITACHGSGLKTPRAVSRPAPASMKTGEDVARYGARVARRLQTWALDLSDEYFHQPVSTYYGEQSIHEFIERSAWHAAQHTRQMMLFLSWIGIESDQPLTDQDLAGLPLPDAVWH